MKRALRALAPVAGSIVVAAFLYEEVFVDLHATGFGDYQEYHHLWESGWIAMTRHGEWPLWNPFQCGGITQYGNPQTQVFHPLFYLSLLVGATIALKLFLVSHAACGVWGAWVLARRVARLSPLASGLAAVVWAGSGYFAYHCGTGHANFIAFYLTPWLIVGWRWAMRDVRWAVLVGLIMSLTVLAGGVYAFPFFVFLVAHEALWSLARPAFRRRVIAAGALSVLVTVLVGGVRLIPILADLQHHPRGQISVDWMDPAMLLRALTVQELAWPMPPTPGHAWLWVEYSQYIGWPALLLAGYGAARAARLSGKRWLLTGTVGFGLLTMGNFADWAPWTLVHELPIYDSLKVPSRFGVLLLLHLALLAALGLDGLRAAATRALDRRRGARALGLGLAILVALVGAVDVVSMHRAVLDGKWRDPPIFRAPPLAYFVATRPPPVRGAGEDEHPVPAWFPQINIGSGYCYSGMRYHGALGLWAGREPQVVIEPGPGELLDEGHTTSTVWATVEVPQPSALVFNRTWAPGWFTDFGPVQSDAYERMRVVVPAGHHRVVLEYRPPTLAVAITATLTGLLLCVLVARMRPGLAAHPVAIVGYVGALAGALAIYHDAIALEPLVEPAGRVARASASGVSEADLNDWYRAEHVLDGRPATEWHLPDAEPGWIDVALEAPTDVAWVRLLNARNAPHRDRAARIARVVAYAGGREVGRSGRVEVPTRWEGEESWVDVTLNARRVDRVRVEILEHHGHSGGLAEIRLPPLPISARLEAGAAASSEGRSGAAIAVIDGRLEDGWAPAATDAAPWVEVHLRQAQPITGAFVRRAPERAPTAPVRLEVFAGDARVGELDAVLREGVTEQMVPIRARDADRVRVRFLEPATAGVAELGVY